MATHRSLDTGLSWEDRLVGQECQILWFTSTVSSAPLHSPYTQTRPWKWTQLSLSGVFSLLISPRKLILTGVEGFWQFYYHCWKCFRLIIARESHSLSDFSKIHLNDKECFVWNAACDLPVWQGGPCCLLTNAGWLCRCGLWFRDQYFISNYPSPPAHHYFPSPHGNGTWILMQSSHQVLPVASAGLQSQLRHSIQMRSNSSYNQTLF